MGDAEHNPSEKSAPNEEAVQKRRAEAAARALAEAAERRAAAQDEPEEGPREIGGRQDGGDPTRYGDWEKKGIAIDF